MYHQAYGIIETLAPLHVGAAAGEEVGNINLIFRDQFTRTGIIPGSSIRGRLRAEMWHNHQGDEKYVATWYGNDTTYNNDVADSTSSNRTTESLVKFEYASIVWLPVFCPGQPIVWVSCPHLLKRYIRIARLNISSPEKYTHSKELKPLPNGKLFFNFGFLSVSLDDSYNWSSLFPSGKNLPVVIVGDDEISMIHDMALYRQSRVALEKDQKRNLNKAFFEVEALPEGTILAFPIGLKKHNSGEQWQPFSVKQTEGDNKMTNETRTNKTTSDIYLGGLESVGFGHCQVNLFNIHVV
jgi:CRISPR-associated protein Cmr4